MLNFVFNRYALEQNWQSNQQSQEATRNPSFQAGRLGVVFCAVAKAVICENSDFAEYTSVN